MAELKTDEETVEDIKKWWKENGTAVILGVAIGLGAIFGWRFWSDYHENAGQRASLAYEQVLIATAGGETESAIRQAETLIDEQGSSAYAMLARLALAKARLAANEPEAAIEALTAAVAEAPDPSLARLAALRLARLQFDQDDLDGARRTIDTHDDGGPFRGDFAALRGHIAASEGETETAASLYREALAAGSGDARVIELLLAEIDPLPIPDPIVGAEPVPADDGSPPAENPAPTPVSDRAETDPADPTSTPESVPEPTSDSPATEISPEPDDDAASSTAAPEPTGVQASPPVSEQPADAAAQPE